MSSPRSTRSAFLRLAALDPAEVVEVIDAVWMVLGAAGQDGHAAIAALLLVGPVDRAGHAKDAVAVPACISVELLGDPAIARLDLVLVVGSARTRPNRG